MALSPEEEVIVRRAAKAVAEIYRAHSSGDFVERVDNDELEDLLVRYMRGEVNAEGWDGKGDDDE